MKLSDIFEIMYPKTLIYSDMMPDKNGINFVSSQEKNNGIVGRVQEVDGIKIYPEGCITVPLKGSVLMAHLQPQKCYVAHQIAVLLPKESMSIQEKLYYVTLIRHNSYKYNYGRQADKTIGDIYIPDSEIYNADRIKSLRYDIITTQNRYSQHPLNIDSWQEFRLDDLFSEIYKAEAHVKGDLEFVESPGANTIKFISRTEMNNGCDCYLPNNGISGIENGNAITIGDTTATCFYQKDEFVCGDHIVVCRAEWLNLYTGLFLVSLLKREQYKYNYGRAFKMDLISNTKVKLPTKSDGTPDFNYMEHYMKSLPYGDRI